MLALIAAHRINTVELDLKDEGGIAGWNPPVALARTIGAAQPIYDLAATVRRLHALGVRVIGRIVCFRDPILATAAWRDGRRNEVVQTPSGGEYAGYGGFTNVADPVVRAYNVAIAVAAARAGVDDILYDYVRRPDGPLVDDALPGPARDRRRLRSSTSCDRHGSHSARTTPSSALPCSASRRHGPQEVAQDVPQMARQVDYIAPLVYPSHWGAGEYGVADPNAQPYQIVQRSLARLRARRRRHAGAARPVAAGLLARCDLRAVPGARRDRCGATRRHRRVPALGSGGDVYVVGARSECALGVAQRRRVRTRGRSPHVRLRWQPRLLAASPCSVLAPVAHAAGQSSGHAAFRRRSGGSELFHVPRRVNRVPVRGRQSPSHQRSRRDGSMSTSREAQGSFPSLDTATRKQCSPLLGVHAWKTVESLNVYSGFALQPVVHGARSGTPQRVDLVLTVGSVRHGFPAWVCAER